MVVPAGQDTLTLPVSQGTEFTTRMILPENGANVAVGVGVGGRVAVGVGAGVLVATGVLVAAGVAGAAVDALVACAVCVFDCLVCAPPWLAKRTTTMARTTTAIAAPPITPLAWPIRAHTPRMLFSYDLVGWLSEA